MKPTTVTCRRHRAPAGWRCTGCGELLCPDCAAVRTVHPVELTVCALCGELAEPLVLSHDARPFTDYALRAAAFPLQGAGRIGLLVGALTLSLGLWLGGPVLVGVLGLLIGSLFGVARAAGRGSDELELSDFTHVGTDMLWPLVRFLTATMPAWGCLVLAFTGHRPWLGVLGAALAVVWCPTTFLAAAAGTPLLTLLNPVAVARALGQMGRDVPKLAGALLVLCVVALLTGLLGAALYALPVPLLSTYAASVVWLYAPWVAARLSGLLLLLHPEPFGWHVVDEPPVLAGVRPRGVPPSKEARVVAPIELPQLLAPPPPAHEVLEARFGSADGAPGSALAPLPARAAAMAELELAPLSSHVREVIAEAMAQGDASAALEAFGATKEVAELDGEQLLWLGRAALSAQDLAAAEHALRLCAERGRDVTAATAMVLRARLLGERLNRREEANALMQRVAAEFAGTRPADFAARWLAGSVEPA